MARVARPVQSGEVIDFINEGGDAIKSGDIVKLGTFCGVAEIDIEPGDSGTVAITKVWDVAADNTTPFDVGDVLYWNGTAATKTKGADPVLGICMAAKAGASSTARVKIGVMFAS